MSARICTRTHIAAIAYAAQSHGLITVTDAPSTADDLLAENVRSVSYRYQHNAEALNDMIPARVVPFTLEELEQAGEHDLTPDELLKACDCYQYQACEHPRWGRSAARALTQRLIAIAHNAGAHSRSAAYANAPWDIPDPVAS